MKVELSIKQRLDLMGVFPEKSSFMERQIAVDIREKVNISISEWKKVNAEEKNGQIKWDKSKEESQSFEFTNAEIEYMKTCVGKLDKSENITDGNFYICKFVKGLQSE